MITSPVCRGVGKVPEPMNEQIRSNFPLETLITTYAVTLTLLLTALHPRLPGVMFCPADPSHPWPHPWGNSHPYRPWAQGLVRPTGKGPGAGDGGLLGVPPTGATLPGSACPVSLLPTPPPHPTSRKHSGRMIDLAGRVATTGEPGRQGSSLHLLVAASQS